MERRVYGRRIVLALLLSTPAVFAQQDVLTKWRVNCDLAGRKLGPVVERARPGDVIEVQGTCRERVTIRTGPLTLDGGGSAVLDGMGVPPNEQEFNGLLTVDGARGVVIRGWTVKNSPGEGILGLRGASMLIQNTLVENNHTGIGLANSSAEIAGSAIRTNSAAGLDAYSNSTVIFRDEIRMSENAGGAALTLNGNSLAEIRGGHVRVENNAQGVIISANSTLAIFGFQASSGTQLTARGNQGPGILIAGGQLFAAGSTLPPGSIVVTSSGNAGPGILLPGNGAVVSPFGTATFVVEDNPVGMQFGQGSSAIIVGGLQVANNTTGIAADGAEGLILVSIPPNPSFIQANGTDLNLGFGTKSTVDGVAVGTIVCDGTVLSRGTTVCPM